MENRLYKIGEISALFGVSVKTLRFYDEAGLLSPELKDNKTGYRYYGIEQCERLRGIMCLRKIGMSINEIARQMRPQKLSNYINALENQGKLISKLIDEHTLTKAYIYRRVEDIKKALNSPHNAVIFEEAEEQRVVLFRKTIYSREEMLEATLEFQQKYDFHPGQGRFGQLFAFEEAAFSVPTCVGLYLLRDVTPLDKANFVIPSGTHAVLYYNQVTYNSEPFWISMLHEIAQKGYETMGHATRAVLVEKGIGITSDEYLAVIRIPVREKVIH